MHFSAHHRFEADIILDKKIEDQSTFFAQDHTAGKWQAKSQAEGDHLGGSLCVVGSLVLLGTTSNQENQSLRVIISEASVFRKMMLARHPLSILCSQPNN